MSNRVNKSIRFVDDYLSGRRDNPKLCLTEEEAKLVSKELPYRVFLKKGNLLSKGRYMWKIRIR